MTDTQTDAETPDVDGRDFFTDDELLTKPYEHLHALRETCPLHREPHHDVVMVTGYDEVVSIYNDTEHFSSCTSVTGPFPGFPVPTEGIDDLSELIEQHRDSLPFSDQLPTMDPPLHTDHRHLLSRMITPKRLKENEAFIARIVDEVLDEAITDDGRCEVIADFAGPVALLVVADLLGVPEEDHPEFRERMLGMKGTVGSSKGSSMGHSPLEYLYEKFSGYISDRRANPQGDVLTGVASATFPDGSTPEVMDAVRVASNLFAAGGETTVRLLSTGVMLLAEDPELQARIRADRDLVPNFVEECLRYESPVRGDSPPVEVPGHRRRRRPAHRHHGDARERGGQPRPRALPRPRHLRPGPDQRPHPRHLRPVVRTRAPAPPLARAEAIVGFNRLLDRTATIEIDEDQHGPADDRRYRYVPTFILRGLTHLHIRFTPA